jgi:hypothetical protein
MTGNSNLNDAFKRVEGEFSRLRRLYVDHMLTPSEFIAELKKLRVKDEAGRYWTIGPRVANGIILMVRIGFGLTHPGAKAAGGKKN